MKTNYEFIKPISTKKALYRNIDGKYVIKKIKAYPPEILNKTELSLYKRYKNSATTRGHSFQISTTTFKRLIKSNCLYCGVSPKQEHNGLIYNGIDRVDNSKGYDIENCIACCGICNRAKGTMSRSDYESYLTRIVNHLKHETEAFENKDILKLMENHNDRMEKAGWVTFALTEND